MRTRPPAATLGPLAVTAAIVVAAVVPAGAQPSDAESPGDATSLGVPLADVRADGGTVATTPDSVPTVYTVTSGEPAHLVAAHAGTGEVLHRTPLPGAESSYSVVAAENGDVYVSTNSNGHLYRLSWGADDIEDLGQVGDGQTFAWDITEGPDGRIYGSTFPGATLYAYDPETGEFQDYGAVSDDTEQARTISSFGDKIYVGTMTPAHLLEVDPATGEKTQIELPAESDPDNDLTSIFDINEAGDKLYVRIGTDIKHAALYEYDPATGEWGESIDAVAGLELPAPGPDGELYVMRDNTLTAWNPATGEHNETSLSYEGRVYNYRGAGWVELDDPDWPGKTLVGSFWRGETWRYNPETGNSDVLETDIPGEPIDIVSLEGAHDGGIWAGGFLGGFGHVDASTGESEFNRFSQTEFLHDDGENVWVGGYPDARGYRYDPDEPFNDPDYSPGPPGTPVNPTKLWDYREHTANPQDRVFAMLPVGDRLLAATGPKGSTFGGSLAIADLTSGDTTFVDDLSPDRALTSLAADDNIVYAGTWVYGGTGSPEPVQDEGTVLAYDLSTGETLWQTSPVEGSASYVATTLDDAGRLWTLAGSTLTELDPTTGDVLRTMPLGDPIEEGRATWPHQLGVIERAPAADVLYVSVGGHLYRVDGESGDAEDLGEFPYSTFAALADGSLAMSSGAELFRWTPPEPGLGQ